ncbi:DM13 domain-containing protein [Actinoplanes sp. DH11]|uniref:DM13 domain-containing protein n=1 Tax=Actinoplanes sp. DH11 TaxID=2857011 RepID=UPI001E4EAC91|nr:DM13 domain-containing protein [Actinoplanes sp. DH11]
MIRRLLTTPVTWIVVVVLGAAALYWFQPWRLFTDTTVSESLTVVASAAPRESASGSPVPAASSSPSPAAPGPVVIKQGTFVTHEHDTTGTARIIREPDGSHRLELAGLNTSDGPDLRVWLSDQPVRTGTAGWRVFDDGEYAELGKLKGNRGDQVYRIGAGVDPAGFSSVSIWCKRFAVSFGAAALA